MILLAFTFSHILLLIVVVVVLATVGIVYSLMCVEIFHISIKVRKELGLKLN